MSDPILTPRDLFLIEAEARRLRAVTLAAWTRSAVAWLSRHMPGHARQAA